MGGEHVVGEAAGAAHTDEHVAAEQIWHHPIPGLESVGARTQLVDPADDLESENVGKRDVEPRHAFTDIDVDVVERADVDLDPYLAWSGLGIRNLLDSQHIPIAVLVEPHSLHASVLSL